MHNNYIAHLLMASTNILYYRRTHYWSKPGPRSAKCKG